MVYDTCRYIKKAAPEYSLYNEQFVLKSNPPLAPPRRGTRESHPFSSSPSLPPDSYRDTYSPRIAVIPGSFLPSIYSSIAPPPVDT